MSTLNFLSEVTRRLCLNPGLPSHLSAPKNSSLELLHSCQTYFNNCNDNDTHPFLYVVLQSLQSPFPDTLLKLPWGRQVKGY